MESLTSLVLLVAAGTAVAAWVFSESRASRTPASRSRFAF